MSEPRNTRTLDAALFNAVFQIIEREGEDKRLFERLANKATISLLTENVIEIAFTNGEIINIQYDLENYFLITFNEQHYCNGEDHTSKMSADRICFYLHRILNLALYGR